MHQQKCRTRTCRADVWEAAQSCTCCSTSSQPAHSCEQRVEKPLKWCRCWSRVEQQQKECIAAKHTQRAAFGPGAPTDWVLAPLCFLHTDGSVWLTLGSIESHVGGKSIHFLYFCNGTDTYVREYCGGTSIDSTPQRQWRYKMTGSAMHLTKYGNNTLCPTEPNDTFQNKNQYFQHKVLTSEPKAVVLLNILPLRFDLILYETTQRDSLNSSTWGNNNCDRNKSIMSYLLTS